MAQEFEGPTGDSLDESTREGFERIRDRLEDGRPVLVGNITASDYGLPGINMPESAQHLGMGAFQKETDEGTYTFDGGGAMMRDGDMSWTPVRGDIDAFVADTGYDVDDVLETVNEILDD